MGSPSHTTCPTSGTTIGEEARTTTDRSRGNLPLDVGRGRDAAAPDVRDNRMPLAAMINPLHRSFVASALDAPIGTFFAHIEAIVSRTKEQQVTATTSSLCQDVEARMRMIERAHGKGAHRHGFPGQMGLSAELLMSASRSPDGGLAAQPTAPADDASSGKGRSTHSDASPVLTQDTGEDAATTGAAAMFSPMRRTKPFLSSSPLADRRPQVFTKTICLPRLPPLFEDMLDSVEEAWEVGFPTSKTPALKTLVQGTDERRELKRSQPFGRASSSMLSKRNAIAKAAVIKGGWTQWRNLMRKEKNARAARKERFGYNEVYTFCVALVKSTKG